MSASGSYYDTFRERSKSKSRNVCPHCKGKGGRDSKSSNNNRNWQSNGETTKEQEEAILADKVRKSLRYHFMNPYQKWKAKGHFPWKLVVQLFKIVLVTIQITTFGLSRSSAVEFLEKNSMAMRNLFLKDWSGSYETLPYPPSSGPYALYRKSEFYEHVDYAMKQFGEIELDAVGTYSFTRKGNDINPMVMCKTRYLEGEIDAFNQTYMYDSEIINVCYELKPFIEVNSSGEEYYVYDSRKYMGLINETVNFGRTISLELKFSLKTVHIRQLSPTSVPDCYQFNVTIFYENEDHDGALEIELWVDETPLECEGEIMYDDNTAALRIALSLFDGTVILISALSAALCLRSIYRLLKVERAASKFFRRYRHKRLTLSDKLEFLDLWYVLIVVNDALTIAGSIFKIQLENKATYDYENAGFLLGTGSLLVWLGVLHYFTFFEKYNILIFTLKKCIPNVLRFLMCAGVIYMGFAFCGWVVLAPYHIKFRKFSTASECLFSLLNGDDMFVTFSALKNYPTDFVWWYSRVYIYTFIALFIYVVSSVFISIIMEAYESIKYYHEHGYPKSDLHDFMVERSDIEYEHEHVAKDCAIGCFRIFSNMKHSASVEETSKLLD